MGPLWGLAVRDPERYGGAMIMLYDPVVRIAEEHRSSDGCFSSQGPVVSPGLLHHGSITFKQMGGG